MCYTVRMNNQSSLNKENFNFGLFLRRFGTNDKCLEIIKDLKYPKGVFCESCKEVTKFYKIEGRQVYQCTCHFQISPLAGTILEKTTTPLQYWFYAIFLMAMTRSGISAKQLQRELGVTYKTAWRMFKQIRMLMADTSGTPLDGIIEADETFVGGKGKNRAYEWRSLEEKPKEILMGMVARGGKVYMKHIPNTGKWTLLKQIKDNVSPRARIYTDDYRGYIGVKYYGYEHDSVNHSAGEYVRGEVHTQNIDNVWSHLKRGIFGVYRVVSSKYLQAYADEFGWRYNNRRYKDGMFERLLGQIAEVKVV